MYKHQHGCKMSAVKFAFATIYFLQFICGKMLDKVFSRGGLNNVYGK